MSKTTVLRPLTVEEQHQLVGELFKNNIWDFHVLNNEFKTVLQDGRTIHINSVIDGKFVNSLFNLFPLTHQILKSVAGDRVIARAYWHKLELGDTIPAHHDRSLFDVVQNRLDSRYQIYLGCPDSEIVIDGVPVNAKMFENTVVDFDLTQIHSFVNNSSQPWVFLVFDVLKPNINFI